jgi:mannitol/fructose-specific phosphotransferase system IIA component (Ntr-type)
VPDVLPFYHTALNQELLFNSALPSGVAVPHARLAAVNELQFALGRAPEPVTWGARGAAAVDLVFLIAVPATNAASYLHLLAAIARLADHPEMLHDLRHAGSRAALLEILGQMPIT